MLRKLVAIALVALLPGCADLQVGRPINKGKIQEIVPGRTTRDEITSREWFGTPLHTVRGADGDILVYRWATGNGRCDELIVSLNGDVVTCYSSQ